MEEKKKQEKLTYEQLNEAMGDMSIQYQKAVSYIRKLEESLEKLQFNRAAFLLESLFKVMDHAELYDEEFVTWAKENIQEAIKSFYEESSDDKKNAS